MKVEDIEIDLIVEAIYKKFGYDFRNYARASLKRRIKHRLALSDFNFVGDMIHEVLTNPLFFDLLLGDLSVNVTEMFRDPSFYRALREQLIPVLRTYPFIKVWHAGCSTGEEVYSFAILLKEEGLYEKAQIYATDFNELVLNKAKEGIFPVDKTKLYTQNYQAAGGIESFSDYYTAKYDSCIINKSLKENIVIANHNLVTDAAFGEMNVIICRNVMIYFNRKLQNDVIGLFAESLCNQGFLCLGSKENVAFLDAGSKFESYNEKERMFVKKMTLS